MRVPYRNKAMVAAIQTVFARSREGYRAWVPRSLRGRPDARHVWRSDATGAADIFRDRHGASPTRLDVWLLVDGSSSMTAPFGLSGGGSRIERAQDLSATLIDAFQRVPSVALQVWQHAANQGTVNMWQIYGPGVNRVAQMNTLSVGGNADAFALTFIAERAKRNLRQDARACIVVLSDGLPSAGGEGATATTIAHLRIVVSEIRQMGIDVFAVSIQPDAEKSTRFYGEANVLDFDVDNPRCWDKLALDFARRFGETLR